jgi:hypothetical protein
LEYKDRSCRAAVKKTFRIMSFGNQSKYVMPNELPSASQDIRNLQLLVYPMIKNILRILTDEGEDELSIVL